MRQNRKKSLSRKLFAFIYCSVTMWGGYFGTLIWAHESEAFIVVAVVQAFLATAYIGGQVFDTFVKSKWFRAELFDK